MMSPWERSLVKCFRFQKGLQRQKTCWNSLRVYTQYLVFRQLRKLRQHAAVVVQQVQARVWECVCVYVCVHRVHKSCKKSHSSTVVRQMCHAVVSHTNWQTDLKRTMPVYFWFPTISRDRPYLLQMMLKFNHVYTSVDLRLHFKPHTLPFISKQGIETL